MPVNLKRLTIALFALLIALAGVAQSCLPEGFRFETQEEIDQFRQDYPDCARILGDVQIHGGNITNLDSLIGVTSFGGILMIYSNGLLSDVSGLANTDTIAGAFEVDMCGALTNIAMPRCQYLGGAIISNNGALATLDLPVLKRSSKRLLVHDNNDMVSASLPQLDTVNGTLYLYNNRDLAQIDISRIRRVDENLTILGVPIDSVFLPDLEFVGESLGITLNDFVKSIRLPQLWHIGLDCNISHMQELTYLDLTALAHLGKGFTMQYNEELESVLFLSELDSIGGIFKIDHCEKLSSLDFIQNVVHIGDFIQVSSTGISDLHALSDIHDVHGSFYLGGNLNMTEIDTGIDICSVDGSLTIIGSSVLTSIAGFRNLATVDGRLGITWTLLENLDEFEHLATVNGEVNIRYNALLQNLGGIADIDPDEISKLVLEHNEQLSLCSVVSICTFLENGGSRTIDDNLTGCYADIEVLEGCEITSSTSGIVEDIGLYLYPNPAGDKIHIGGYLTPGAELNIFSHHGHLLLKAELPDHRTFDLSSLIPGVYFLSVNLDGKVYTDRFVVSPQ